MSSTVTIERLGGTALVRLNRPEAKNALNMEMRKALRAGLDELAVDVAIRALVITGAGNAFCAGGDFKAVTGPAHAGRPSTTRSLRHDVQPLLECIARMDKPVIAAVNGPAVGFGMSLALACDFMVMGPEGYLLAQFIKLGLIPDGGAVWFLTRRIGYPRALEAILGAQKLTADLCVAMGIANRIAGDGDVQGTALSWADELARAAPVAMAYTKRLARLALSNRLEESLLLEAEFQGICVTSADSREAIAALQANRPPVFTGG